MTFFSVFLIKNTNLLSFLPLVNQDIEFRIPNLEFHILSLEFRIVQNDHSKFEIQYFWASVYLIMVCCNTQFLYWVIQLLRKHHIFHCLSLLMLWLWCYFYVHLQSFSESLSCFEEFQVDLLTFIIIFLYIFSEAPESSNLYGGVIGGVVGAMIIVMLILGIIYFKGKKGNTFCISNHLLGRMWTS